MKPSDIRIGATYRNRGRGRTRRKVIDLGSHLVDKWPFLPSGDNVLFEQNGKQTTTMSLKSFARWAGSEVQDVDSTRQTAADKIGRAHV